MVTIQVLGARSLKSTDPNGLSDPFCIIGVAHHNNKNNDTEYQFVDALSCVTSEVSTNF